MTGSGSRAVAPFTGACPLAPSMWLPLRSGCLLSGLCMFVLFVLTLPVFPV